jgi:hypothetical protein
MSRGNASGHVLKRADASIIMGMVARGDRDHDIAAWFGVNQGRIAEVKDGSKFGIVAAAQSDQLPPKGPPGIKGRRIEGRCYASIICFERRGLENTTSVSGGGNYRIRPE